MRRAQRLLLDALKYCLKFGLIASCAVAPLGIVAAPAINLQLSSATVILVPGTSQSITVSAAFVGGPSRAVLGWSGLPPGLTATFQPTLIESPEPGVNVTSVMTITADSTVVAGRFVFDVIAAESGTDFKVSGQAQVTGIVEEPFSLTLGGSSTANAGESVALSVLATRKPGFTKSITLSVDPASVPILTAVRMTPMVLTGNDVASTVQLNLDSDARPALYRVRVTGSYGSTRVASSHVVNVLLAPVPPEITISAAPASATIAPGESTSYQLAFTRNFGTLGFGQFTQTVSGLPPGASATFLPAVPTPPSQLVVATTSVTPDGTYPLTVTAMLGTLVKVTTVDLVVATPRNFTMTLTPAAVTVARLANTDIALEVQRTGPKSDVTVTIDALTVPAGVVVTSTPTVLNTSTTAASVKVTVGATANAGTYSITVRGVSGSLTRTAILTLTIPPPPPSDVTIRVLTLTTTVASGGTTQIPIRLTRTGTAVGALLELRTSGVPLGGNAWITPSTTLGDSATLNVIGGNAGIYFVGVSVVRGAFPPTDIAGVTVTASSAGDFSILPAPQTLSVPTGTPTSAAVQIGRTNGFAGAVSFVAITDRPSDYQVTFSLNSTTGSGIGMTITANSNVPTGPHVLRLRGTSGSIVREVSMTVDVTSAPPYMPPYYPFGIKRPPQ